METRPEISPLTPEPINDKTFNRLKELQKLIKKEYALKELCKQKNIII